MRRREKPKTATDKKEKYRERELSVSFYGMGHIFRKKGGGKMQKNEVIKKRHDLVVEDRKVLKATGICDVEGFDETKVYAMLEDMAFTVCGKGLKVVNFSSESGELRIEGEIDSVTYTSALSRRAGIFARIFR